MGCCLYYITDVADGKNGFLWHLLEGATGTDKGDLSLSVAARCCFVDKSFVVRPWVGAAWDKNNVQEDNEFCDIDVCVITRSAMRRRRRRLCHFSVHVVNRCCVGFTSEVGVADDVGIAVFIIVVRKSRGDLSVSSDGAASVYKDVVRPGSAEVAVSNDWAGTACTVLIYVVWAGMVDVGEDFHWGITYLVAGPMWASLMPCCMPTESCCFAHEPT